LAGPIDGVSAYMMKHPPIQFTDDHARQMVEAFIATNAKPGRVTTTAGINGQWESDASAGAKAKSPSGPVAK